jgi:diguanylate cyclase (GGDEF)-like protein
MTMGTLVLLVDDDPDFLRLLSAQLADNGHTALTTTSGFEAMRILISEAPPVVITDWMMPGMNGLELCRAIRRQSGEGVGFTYVIILTAQNRDDYIVEALEAGADDCLAKPVNLKELLARLRAAQRIIHLQEDLEKRNREVQRCNAEMEIMNSSLAAANHKLSILAAHDELTGLINRREAMNRLTEIWSASTRYNEPFACILLDVDHFKKVNDRCGHDAGDLVLRELGDTLRSSARAGEPVARIGGEEFLVLCPRATADAAAVGAERLRRTVQSRPIQAGPTELSVTISAGVAQRTPSTPDFDAVLKAADDALYAAKRAGRNRVFVAAEPGVAIPYAPQTTPLHSSVNA